MRDWHKSLDFLASSQPAAVGADAYGSEGTWEWRPTNNGPVTGTQWCKGFVQYSWREAVYDFPGAASLRHLADLSGDLWGLVHLTSLNWAFV